MTPTGIRSRHVPFLGEDPGVPTNCLADNQAWPCEVAVVLEENERLWIAQGGLLEEIDELKRIVGAARADIEGAEELGEPVGSETFHDRLAAYDARHE